MFIGPEAQLPRVDAVPNESQIPFTEAQSQVVITRGRWEESAISRTQEVGVKDRRDREHSNTEIQPALQQVRSQEQPSTYCHWLLSSTLLSPSSYGCIIRLHFSPFLLCNIFTCIILWCWWLFFGFWFSTYGLQTEGT